MHPSASLTPVEKNERIYSLDIIRGFVLLGILLMNIVGFGLGRGTYRDPTISGGSDGLNLRVWEITTMFFEGTMRGLFSLLFGVGMFILTDRLEKKGGGIKVADIYFRRTLWLMFFGLVHAYLLLWGGEILFSYGVMGLLVFSFRRMAPTKLVAIAIFLILCGNLWDYSEHRSNIEMVKNAAIAKQYTAEGKPVSRDLKDAQTKWAEVQYQRSPEGLNEMYSKMRQGYFKVVAYLAPMNKEGDMTDSYQVGSMGCA